VTEDKIHVKQAYVVGTSKGTKTGKNRTVVMLPQLRNRMKLWAMTWKYPTEGWVFPNQTGTAPINMNDLSSRVIATTLKKFGLEWQGFYSARRGFGTMLVLAGATLDEVADAMGNSPDVVFKHYFKDRDSTLAAKGIAKLAAAMDEHEMNQKTLTTGGAQ
jgi:integrase